MSQIFVLPKQVVIDPLTLLPSPGAKAYFYLTGTSTPAVVYSDAALTTPITQPVVADAAGILAVIYIDASVTYKLTLNRTDGSLLYTVDPADERIVSTEIKYSITAAEAAASVTPVNYFYQPGHILRYGTNTIPGTTDMSTARQKAHDQFAAGGAPVYVPAGTYKADTALAIAATTAGTPAHIYGDGEFYSLFTTALNVEGVTTTGADATHYLMEPYIHDIGFKNTYPVTAGLGCTKFHIRLINALRGNCERVYCKTPLIDTDYSTSNVAGISFEQASFPAAFMNRVTDCWLDHAQINMSTSDSTISGGVLWGNCFDYGIKLGSGNIGVYNMYDLLGSKSHGAVYVTAFAATSRIQNNFIDGAPGGLVDSGFGIYADATNVVTVSGNTFWGMKDAGIWLTNPVQWNITGNAFLNCGTRDAGPDGSDIVINAVAFASQNLVSSNTHYRNWAATVPSYAVYERNGGANPTSNIIMGSVVLDTGTQYATPVIKLATSSGSKISACFGRGVGGGLTFTGTLTGCTTAPTASVMYTYDGNCVDIRTPALTATSNTGACTMTGLPAWLWPTALTYVYCYLTNNGTSEQGLCSVDTSGVITLSRGTFAAFTAAGTKGFNDGFTLHYQRT